MSGKPLYSDGGLEAEGPVRLSLKTSSRSPFAVDIIFSSPGEAADRFIVRFESMQGKPRAQLTAADGRFGGADARIPMEAGRLHELRLRSAGGLLSWSLDGLAGRALRLTDETLRLTVAWAGRTRLIEVRHRGEMKN